jgi:hypothetical protein
MDAPFLHNIEGIAKIPPILIGDDSSLIRTLEEDPLTNWKTKVDALPQQFNNATLAAAKLLEPKIRTVQLTSGILKTEDDVRFWVRDVEMTLRVRLKMGQSLFQKEQGVASTTHRIT